jgi:hypothetical protein
MRSLLESFRKAFIGTRIATDDHKRAMSRQPDIISGIRQLEKICPIDAVSDNDAPIFLFSTSWRSGSTLLQRLIISDPKVLIWGEPYNICGIIQHLAETMIPFREDWPPAHYLYRSGVVPDRLKGEWIANFYPGLNDYWRGHRALFDTLFAEPARRTGAEQWGIKEVRLDIDHAYYLRWLYPGAKFVFLYRNPLHAYLSYASFGRDCYYTWPDRPVFTPTAFGLHWRRLAEGFIKDSKKIGAILVRYEDINHSDDVIRQLEGYLDIRIDRSLLAKKVSGYRNERTHLSRLEKWLLQRAVSPTAEELGYKW